MIEALCMALLTGGTLATPMPVMIDIHIMIEGQREPFHAFLQTDDDKDGIHYIVCPQDFIFSEDLPNAQKN